MSGTWVRLIFILILFPASFAPAQTFWWGYFYSSNIEGSTFCMRIDSRGRIATSLPVTLPDGQITRVTFPAKLAWDVEHEIFHTSGFYDVLVRHADRPYRCRYQAKAQVSFIQKGEEVDVSLSFPQRYYIDEKNFCRATGEAEVFYLFRPQPL